MAARHRRGQQPRPASTRKLSSKKEERRNILIYRLLEVERKRTADEPLRNYAIRTY